MSVVSRISRSYLFEAKSAQRPFVQVAPDVAVQPQDDGSSGWCAASLIASDTVAFAIASVIAATAVGALSRAGYAWALNTAAGAPVREPWLWLICSYAGLIGYFASHAHYDHRSDFWSELREIVVGSFAAAVLVGFAAYVLGQALPQVSLAIALFALVLLVPLLRQITRFVLDRAGVWRVPVVVVGSGAWSEMASSALRSARRLGYAVVGHSGPAAVLGGGTPAPWKQLLAQHGARMIVLAFDPEHPPAPGLTASLVRERVPFAVMPQLDGLPVNGCRHTHLVNEDAVIQTFKNNLDKPVARLTKIVFDLTVASLALLVLAPVLVLVAAAVSLDGGPVLYGHKRIGARGRVFKCLKFRSMVVDSDAVLQRLLSEDPAAAEEWARTHKLRRDPRVTWIGRILRKTSLDELPQLLNVIRLEMSLVGPRPIVSLEIPKYAEDIAYYYETRPGITGLWQVSGRSDTSYAQRVRLDSWYVKNWTIWQDLAILFKTVPAVVSGRGAG